ncbi:MAG: hypothetical protein M3Y77_13005 [Actinomycetota bacterium]|nr:hypothetical protein [Actinomycetota bacterium]
MSNPSIVQEAFIRLIDRWERISGYDAPEAWMRLVAIRLARGHLRRHRLGVLTDIGTPSIGQPSDWQEEHKDLHRALDTSLTAIVRFWFRTT